MPITVEKCGGWGDRLKVTNGKIELEVTTSFGPRILHFSLTGGKNHFYENKQMNLRQTGKAFEVFGENDGWYIYGGHRLWHSPESLPRTYYPDNEPVAYEITATSVLLKPPAQKYTNLQNLMEIKMHEDNTVDIIHTVTNNNAWSVKFAPWALTLAEYGGLEAIPLPKEDTGLLGNGLIALWPYSKMNDPRVYWGEKYITLYQNKNISSNFKIGITNKEGYVLYFNHNQLFTKEFCYDKNSAYPDGGMNFETFTSPDILEIETIGKLQEVNPGDSVTHIETWKLFDHIDKPAPSDEAAIDAAFQKTLR